jgi:molecular chaperone GrpE (heat shock protein)
MEDATTLPAADQAAQVEDQQPATEQPAQPETPVQPTQPTQPPTPAALLQQKLSELGVLMLGLEELRQQLTERERIYRSIGAELESRRVRIEIDEARAAKLQGAAEALQALVQGGAQ